MSINISADTFSDKLFDKVFENFKKVTPALFAITFFTGMILFLPDKVLEKMSLSVLPNSWRIAIGLLFLLCLALIITIFLFSTFSKIRRRVNLRKFKKKQRKRLVNLNGAQKKIICQLFAEKDKAIQLDKISGDTIYLLTNNFLYQPQQIFSPEIDNSIQLIYVPQPWLMELYNEEPELFKYGID